MFRSCTALSFVVAVASACGASDGDGTGGGPDAGVSGDVTYYQDIKPIVDAKCVRCHVDGGVAPFGLEGYEAVRDRAGVSLLEIEADRMPPWKANHDCNDYVGDFSLTDHEKALFATWVDQGTPEGDPSKPGDPIPVEDTRLSRVDLTLSMPEAYTARTARDYTDDYRCFVIEWPAEFTTTKYVAGFKAVPGHLGTVHHVIAYYATPEQAQAYYDLDAEDPQPGYQCFGGPGGPAQTWIGGWAPGGQGFDMPPGTGMPIEPGSLIVLQVHYNTLYEAPQPDITSVQFKLEDAVDREVWTQPWANPQWLSGTSMHIPAGEKDVVHSWQFDLTWLTNGDPLLIYSAGLHMHNLGTRGISTIRRADGGEDCLIQIDDWDFDWQDGYGLRTPARFNPGDQLYLECHWDNSPENQVVVDGQPRPPQDVYWGDGSTDEMCLGVFLVSRAD
ncbi:MAG: monooxygenase [Deltaproteobacteria bacterium]|nr:MAG: monooxygenase [Deltaproteobacteria bacterium]